MTDVRGPRPAAECPRCGEHGPPPEARLATCATCGLVFAPHEIEHRAPPPPPLAEPPATMTAIRDDHRIVVRLPLQRWTAPFAVAGGSFVAWVLLLVWGTSWWWLGIPLGLAIFGFAYLGAAALVSSHVITIDRDTIRHRILPLPLGHRPTIARRGVITVEVVAQSNIYEGVHTLYLRTASAAVPLLSLRNRTALRYLGELISAQGALPLVIDDDPAGG